MAFRLEISLRPELRDAEGLSICRKAREYLNLPVKGIRVIRVLTLDLPLSEAQRERVRRDLFTNPVTEISSFSPMARDFDWAVWIGLRPGVRDTAGSTALEAVEDLLATRFPPPASVYTSKLFVLETDLPRNDVARIATELLANDIIQQWRIFSPQEWDPHAGIGLPVPRVVLNHTPEVKRLSIASDEILRNLSHERNLALQDKDIPVIRRYFAREDILRERRRRGLDLPTDIELEYISQARSDHCNHNTFRGLFWYKDLDTGYEETVDNLFRSCIEAPTLEIQARKDWVVSVLWDNAGVARFDEEHHYVITGETHNSPSNMEAYGGAITGIVGIYRDPMGTGLGARLTMGLYAYCVGHRDYAGPLKPHLHPRRLLDGVIEGVRDGGNKSGIPTPYGLLLFHDGYLGKCLVFVTALGIMPARVMGAPSHLKETRPGDLILMVGGRVGKDGIHGVTASSETYSEHTPAGHVQIGDPYTQKKMHDFLLEARDQGLVAYITDNGGGGLSSSIGESARWSDGAEVDLDRVPLKYEGLDHWEIWVSESQERMTVAVRPENLDRFLALSRLHAVESTVIGRYTDSGYLHLRYGDETCAYVRMDLLKTDFPQWAFEAEWRSPESRGLREPVLGEPSRHGDLLRTMLARPNLCCRNWIARQYDHEVQGGSVIKPLLGRERDIPCDAAVIRPVLTSPKAIAVAQAMLPFYSEIDTYPMTAATMDEAVRKVVATGGDPSHLGGVDNFCWPSVAFDSLKNPDGKYKAAQLVRSCWALRDVCLAYGIPLLSGKDSMYIDGSIEGAFGERHKVSGLPTLLFTVSSVLEEATLAVTLDVKFPGDLVYVVGETRDELGGSEYYQMLGTTGLNVPRLDPGPAFSSYGALHRAILRRCVSSCHAVSRGGLGVHFALVAMAGMLGMDVLLSKIPAPDALGPAGRLYSESCGRFVVTVAPDMQGAFEETMAGCNVSQVGLVIERPVLLVRGAGEEVLLEEPLDALKAAWKRRFGGLL